MNAKKELFPHKTTSADLKRVDGSLLRSLVDGIEALIQRAREVGLPDKGTIYESADQYLEDAIDLHNTLALSHAAVYKSNAETLEKIVEWRPMIQNDRQLQERFSRILRKEGYLQPDPFKSQAQQPAPELQGAKPDGGMDDRVEPGGITTMLGNGESYRPNRPRSRPRSPPRADTFRSDRDRSPRRARSPPASDSYHPGSRDRSPRRRSPFRRTPPRDNWRTSSPPRARSPPRRFSPRRDDDRRERARSPRDDRRRSRSPYDRDRTTTCVRSPIRRRSPPSGPRGSYRARSRSLDRRDDRVPTGPSSSNWRRRSPSPPPRESERSSARTSGSNSRRSSPQIHPSRLAAVQQASRPRSPPMTRGRSPPAQIAYRDRDSARSTPRERSPVRPRSPPRGPATFRPPTGPGGARNFTAPSPSPTISTSSTPMSVSAHNRQDTTPVAPPAGPRAQFAAPRGGYTGRGGRGSFGHDRQSRPDMTAWGAAPSRPINDFASRPTRTVDPVSRPPPASPSVPTGPSSSSIPTGPSGGIPTGPRASVGIPSRPSLQHSSSIYGSRSQSSATSNGSRPHPAMANMAQIIPGGRIDPTASGMSNEISLRIKKREDEAEGLRTDLEAKQDALRKNLKEYERIKSESAQWALRSELSERHVRTLAGEGVGGAAF